MEHYDVLIVGAGISGLGAAHHLRARCPALTFAILEGRERLGGTWDLFRYPGIRSDSDMYTLGFSFRPWRGERSIADGPSILRYLDDMAREEGLGARIRTSHRVERAQFSSHDARWTVEVHRTDTDERLTLSCRYLFMCSGYYDYAEGYTPDFEGLEDFRGRVVHPQQWSDDVAYAGQRVVVIGSGATAVTLVPALAKEAAHVTMLQRSPTYIVSVPGEDPIGKRLRASLPPRLAHRLTRLKNILVATALYQASRRYPARMRALFLAGVRKELGPDFDVETHFTPRYDPWDERLCLVPDADLFRVIREGRASVVTDHIERFTEKGILLRSGQELEADLVVTATGLKLSFMSNVELTVDGERVDPAKLYTYKAMMFSDVPNLALWFGYTNASWTLKADLTSEYMCRLLNHMEARGYRRFVPRMTDSSMGDRPFLGLASGYVSRGAGVLPKQGTKTPWRIFESYLLDRAFLRRSRVDDDAMELS